MRTYSRNVMKKKKIMKNRNEKEMKKKKENRNEKCGNKLFKMKNIFILLKRRKIMKK